MAGMFYSLQEAAEKLNKTKEELQEIVKAGKLREFRDGPNLLFKVDEVESLMSDTSVMGTQEPAAPQPPVPEAPELEVPEIEAAAPEAPQLDIPEAEIPLDLEAAEIPAPEIEIPEPALEEFATPELPELAVPELEAPAPEVPQLDIPEAEIPLDLEAAEIPAPEMEIPEPAPEEPAAPEAPEMEVPELEAAAPEVPQLDIPEAEIPPDLEAAEIPAPEMEIPEPAPEEPAAPEIPAAEIPVPEAPVPQAPPPPEIPADSSEILLAPETGASLPPSELTNADTAITGEGITVLGETDQDYDVTEDTMGETVGTMGTTGTSPEASLEEIEEDVNLDSFGSGSGLLDLSLQADDTSLGGILDEIYTAEEEEAAEPAEAGTVEDVVAEADQMLADEELVASQVTPEMSAFAQVRYEPPPDKASNILGAMLILPILLAFYTAIVALSGQRGVAPFAMTAIQGFIWYIMGGLIVAAGAVGIWAFMAGAEATGTAKKPKKPKKPRKPKKAKKGKGLPPPTPEDSVA